MTIDETVYILGAGVNQPVEAWGGLRPPLANNFFQLALQSSQFADPHYTQRIQPVYDFLVRYFKKTKEQLQHQPFDLEELFTTLELQQDAAYRAGEQQRLTELAQTEFLLKSFLAEYLSQFEIYATNNDTMRELGRIMHAQGATVLSFNYDCILEPVLELASGVRTNIPSTFSQRDTISREVNDDELVYSHYNWNRPLAYAFTFSEIQLQQAGLPKYVEGDRFYGHPSNALYESPLIKLHGSLNWFRFLPIRRSWMGPAPAEFQDWAAHHPELFGETPPLLPDSRHDAIILVRGHWWGGQPPDFDGWLIDPVLVTPVLYKQRILAKPLFQQLWTRAKTALSNCKKLIVIGYSFPPTDFHTRDLLRDAFQRNPPDEVVVVNPDRTVATKVLELTHFEAAPALYRKVEDYVRSVPRAAAVDPPPPVHTYSPGDRVTVATGRLELGGLSLTGCLFSGVTIASRNRDGTYQVRGMVNIGGMDEVTIPPDWIQPYETPP